MFSKVLIANRGEIAVRVIRTCQRLGIKTAIVYSDADARSLAVDMADEAVRIGPAPAADSYLNIKAVVKAAKAVGADAVHPGFGFLSENPAFAAALAKANITFIGPNPHAIDAMGDKIRSKQLAQDAGVNIVPGHVGEIASANQAAQIAEDIGYPVMIKASAGGGGKGMRIAWGPDDVREGFDAARNEAKGAFGDDRIFVEKFIERPRHIEIQILGDKHGNIIHLGERECSIQRRNQKVIEEAPSPYLTDETREKMAAQAIALAKAVDYDSAGTVEFIADQHQNFYFLEMNTRLQVEHPVTECITGIDLVEQMLHVASGRPLDITQNAVRIDGWAMEARIYAEDPVRGFVPSIGRLKRWRRHGSHAVASDDGGLGTASGVRLDTGVREGDEITPHYDPMLAKLVVSAETRRAAVDALATALAGFDVDGVTTNVDFCTRLCGIEDFKNGNVHTGFIEEHGLEGPVDPTARPHKEKQMLAVIADQLETTDLARLYHPGPPPWTTGATKRVAIVDGEPVHLVLTRGDDDVQITFPDPENPTATPRHPNNTGKQTNPIHARVTWQPGSRSCVMHTIDAQGRTTHWHCRAARTGEGWALTLNGVTSHVIATSPERGALRLLIPEREDTGGAAKIISPMPGLVRAVSVEAGQEVKAGDPLAIIEAMKMENIIRAERPGVLSSIDITPGDSVAADQVLMVFEHDQPMG